MKDGQRSLHFRSGEYKEITDLRTLWWPIQINGTFWNILKKVKLTRKAGLAPSFSKHLTADVHRLEAAMCKAVPKSKSLQVASTSRDRGIREILWAPCCRAIQNRDK